METTKAQSEDGNQNTTSSSLTDETKKLGEVKGAPELESEQESETVVVAEVVEANEPKPEPEVKRVKDDKENDEYVPASTEEAIHYRINFRCRNRVLSDAIYVDSTTPDKEVARDPIGKLQKNKNGETVAQTFQFRHELKETTYKNVSWHGGVDM